MGLHLVSQGSFSRLVRYFWPRSFDQLTFFYTNHAYCCPTIIGQGSFSRLLRHFWLRCFDRLDFCVQIMYIVGPESLAKVFFQAFWGIFDRDSFDRLDLLYTNHVSSVIDIECHCIEGATAPDCMVPHPMGPVDVGLMALCGLYKSCFWRELKLGNQELNPLKIEFSQPTKKSVEIPLLVKNALVIDSIPAQFNCKKRKSYKNSTNWKKLQKYI